MSKKNILTIFFTCWIALFGLYSLYRAVDVSSGYENTLTITTRSGAIHQFQVELALTPKAQQTGLMHRQSMDMDHGMLFVFPKPSFRAFWMKNTYIPLDLYYISSTGRIDQIYKMTTPLSTEALPSHAPAFAVLEINGGLSDQLGIKVGDVVQHAIFYQKDQE